MHFTVTPGDTRFELKGTTQTLAGLDSVGFAGVYAAIQHSEFGTPAAVDGTSALILNVTGANSYTFGNAAGTAVIRDYNGGAMSLTKNGTGTQTLDRRGHHLHRQHHDQPGRDPVGLGQRRTRQLDDQQRRHLAGHGHRLDQLYPVLYGQCRRQDRPVRWQLPAVLQRRRGRHGFDSERRLAGGHGGRLTATTATSCCAVTCSWAALKTAPSRPISGWVTTRTRTFTVNSTGDPSGVDLDITGNFSHFNGVTWGYMIKDGAGTMRFASTSTNQVGSLTNNAGKVLFVDQLNGWGNGGIINNAVFEANIGTGLDKTYASALTGTGTFIKSGAGKLQFNGGSQVISQGQFFLQGGTLQNNNNSVNWSGNTGDMDISTGAILDLYADPIFVDQLTGSGIVQNNYGNASGQSGASAVHRRFVVGVANGSSTFDGVIRNNSRTNTPGSATAGGGVQLEKVGDRHLHPHGRQHLHRDHHGQRGLVVRQRQHGRRKCGHGEQRRHAGRERHGERHADRQRRGHARPGRHGRNGGHPDAAGGTTLPGTFNVQIGGRRPIKLDTTTINLTGATLTGDVIARSQRHVHDHSAYGRCQNGHVRQCAQHGRQRGVQRAAVHDRVQCRLGDPDRCRSRRDRHDGVRQRRLGRGPISATMPTGRARAGSPATRSGSTPSPRFQNAINALPAHRRHGRGPGECDGLQLAGERQQEHRLPVHRRYRQPRYSGRRLDQRTDHARTRPTR